MTRRVSLVWRAARIAFGGNGGEGGIDTFGGLELGTMCPVSDVPGAGARARDHRCPLPTRCFLALLPPFTPSTGGVFFPIAVNKSPEPMTLKMATMCVVCVCSFVSCSGGCGRHLKTLKIEAMVRCVLVAAEISFSPYGMTLETCPCDANALLLISSTS